MNEMTPKSWREGIIMIPDLKQWSLYIMRLTFVDRLKMCQFTVLAKIRLMNHACD